MTLLEHWNAGMALLGVEAIPSFSSNFKAARLGNILATQCRDALLGDHYWNFATEFRQLAEVAVAPVSNYSHVFELDVDVISVIHINAHSDEDWIIGADKTLHTDATSVLAAVINKETDTSKYPSYFTNALIHLMAWKGSYSMVQSGTLREALARDAQNLAAQARSMDGREGQRRKIQKDVYIDARFGRSGQNV